MMRGQFIMVYLINLIYTIIIIKNGLRGVLDSSRNMALGYTDRTMPCRPGFHTASVFFSAHTFGLPCEQHVVRKEAIHAGQSFIDQLQQNIQ